MERRGRGCDIDQSLRAHRLQDRLARSGNPGNVTAYDGLDKLDQDCGMTDRGTAYQALHHVPQFDSFCC